MKQTTMLQEVFTSIAGRVLIGYLVFKICVNSCADAAALEKNDDICAPETLREYLSGDVSQTDIKSVYKHCRDQFLGEHKPGANVKQTIDDWIGTDLSRAETDHIFLIYELVLTSPRPVNISKEFETECNKMEQEFETYRNTVEPLTDRIDINLDSLLSNGIDEIDGQERELFNFVQYSQFCRSLLLDDDGKN